MIIIIINTSDLHTTITTVLDYFVIEVDDGTRDS